MKHRSLNLIYTFQSTSGFPLAPNFMSQNILLIILLYWIKNIWILQNILIYIRSDSKHDQLMIFYYANQVRILVIAIWKRINPSAFLCKYQGNRIFHFNTVTDAHTDTSIWPQKYKETHNRLFANCYNMQVSHIDQ